jgi:hypothetical protein
MRIRGAIAQDRQRVWRSALSFPAWGHRYSLANGQLWRNSHTASTWWPGFRADGACWRDAPDARAVKRLGVLSVVFGHRLGHHSATRLVPGAQEAVSAGDTLLRLLIAIQP